MNKPHNNSENKLTPIQEGVLIGIVLTLVFLFFTTIIVGSITKEETYINGKATWVQPLTDTTLDKVFMGKACSYEKGCIHDAAIFVGSINEASASQFIAFLESNPNIQSVCFGSGGGEINAAKQMSDAITKRKLSTCLAEYYYHYNAQIHITANKCSSSCNQLLLSSEMRIRVGKQVRFRGHAYASGSDYSGSFLGTDTHWALSHSKIIDNNLMIEAIEQANTADKQFHLAYAKKVSTISHFETIKTLNESELEYFKIFTQTI